FFSSRRRHTRWPRDWSSDVCSSDLGDAVHRVNAALARRSRHVSPKMGEIVRYGASWAGAYLVKRGRFLAAELPALLGEEIAREEIGRASCRERVEMAVGGV